MTTDLVDVIESKLKKYSIDKSDLFKFKVNFRIFVFFETWNFLNKKTKCKFFRCLISQITVKFESIKSDLICVEYSDKIFIAVTSTGRFGAAVLKLWLFHFNM